MQPNWFFQSTNNVAKFEAFLLALRKLKSIEVKIAILKSDSQVITCHVDKSSKVKAQHRRSILT
jgi:ribonuclease HI